MEDLKAIVAKNMAALRSAQNMTQAELGEKLNYSDKSISKWERGEAIPDVRVLKEMAQIFHVTVDYLITPHEPGEKPTPDAWTHQYSSSVITLVTITGIWALALFMFVLLWILGKIYWLIFVFAVPVSLVTWLVLNSIWNGGKYNFYIISGLLLSILVAIYLSFLPQNWWQLFLLLIPGELIAFLSFHIKIRRKNT